MDDIFISVLVSKYYFENRTRVCIFPEHYLKDLKRSFSPFVLDTNLDSELISKIESTFKRRSKFKPGLKYIIYKIRLHDLLSLVSLRIRLSDKGRYYGF